MSFIVWGGLNGIYQVVAEIYFKIYTLIHTFLCNNCAMLQYCDCKDEQKISYNILKTIMTFIIISFAWIFFAANSFRHSVWIIRRMFVFNWNVLFDNSLYALGVDRNYTRIIMLGIILLMIVDWQKYKEKDILEYILAQDWWFRAFVFVGLTLFTLIFGCYGELYDTQQFIYFLF